MSTSISSFSKQTKTVGFGPLRSRFTLDQSLDHFCQLMSQSSMVALIWNQGQYDRIFNPLITLWYFIFQRINTDHSLQTVVSDAHQGGADGLDLREDRLPLSQRISSAGTTAFNNARKRFSLSDMSKVLTAQVQHVYQSAQGWGWHGLHVQLLDGSTVRLRPHGDIPQHFPPSLNQHGSTYWCLMHVVVSICAQTGLVVASTMAALTTSEQVLACQLILQNVASKILYLGDRNFGIFRIAQTAQKAGASVLVSLTISRAAKLLGKGRKLLPGDYPVIWSPSRQDQCQPDIEKLPIHGRLIVTRLHRKGFRDSWLFLFTTLVDSQTYSAPALVELYAKRWQIELNLRDLKSQMDLDALGCKSAEMAQKEWMAGLLAYNLIRSLMVSAAIQHNIPILRLSFSATRRCLFTWLHSNFNDPKNSYQRWVTLLKLVAKCRLPLRLKPRPPEPRAKRHVRESFPPLRGDRQAARAKLALTNLKC